MRLRRQLEAQTGANSTILPPPTGASSSAGNGVTPLPSIVPPSSQSSPVPPSLPPRFPDKTGSASTSPMYYTGLAPVDPKRATPPPASPSNVNNKRPREEGQSPLSSPIPEKQQKTNTEQSSQTTKPAGPKATSSTEQGKDDKTKGKKEDGTGSDFIVGYWFRQHWNLTLLDTIPVFKPISILNLSTIWIIPVLFVV